jgi:hypothetical protein
MRETKELSGTGREDAPSTIWGPCSPTKTIEGRISSTAWFAGLKIRRRSQVWGCATTSP